MTVPNEFAQQEMLENIYQGANINPKDVDFIEAHGTGTIVGDPKECTAFGNVFAKDRDPKNPLIIGSIKSNIGHAEAVAGIAGLTKLALCIKNKQIPQNLHFNNPNPKIKFDEWKLKVPTKLMKWPNKDGKKPLAELIHLVLAVLMLISYWKNMFRTINQSMKLKKRKISKIQGKMKKANIIKNPHFLKKIFLHYQQIQRNL